MREIKYITLNLSALLLHEKNAVFLYKRIVVELIAFFLSVPLFLCSYDY